MKLQATYSARRGEKKFSDITMPDKTKYEIDNDGFVTVDDEEHAEYLLDTGNFKNGDEEIDKPKPMIIKNGDEEVDLMTLDKAALLALANEEMDLGIDARTGEKKIRIAIMEYVADSE